MRTISLTLLLVACASPATPYDACDVSLATPTPGTCTPCADDGQCTFQGNPCLDTVACAHTDDDLAFVLIGCDPVQEHPWPPDTDCRCVDEVCTVR